MFLFSFNARLALPVLLSLLNLLQFFRVGVCNTPKPTESTSTQRVATPNGTLICVQCSPDQGVPPCEPEEPAAWYCGDKLRNKVCFMSMHKGKMFAKGCMGYFTTSGTGKGNKILGEGCKKDGDTEICRCSGDFCNVGNMTEVVKLANKQQGPKKKAVEVENAGIRNQVVWNLLWMMNLFAALVSWSWLWL